MMLQNKGQGSVKSFTVNSARLSLVDSNSGFIRTSYTLLSTKLYYADGQSANLPSPTLTAPLQAISSQSTASVVWKLTSNVDANFNTFTSTFRHVDALLTNR